MQQIVLDVCNCLEQVTLPGTMCSDIISPWVPSCLFNCKHLKTLVLPERMKTLFYSLTENPVTILKEFPGLTVSFQQQGYIEYDCQFAKHCTHITISNINMEKLRELNLSPNNQHLRLDYTFVYPFMDISDVLGAQPHVLRAVELKNCPTSKLSMILKSLKGQKLEEIKIIYGSYSRWISSVCSGSLLHQSPEILREMKEEAKELLNFPTLKRFNAIVAIGSPLFDAVSQLPRLTELSGLELPINSDFSIVEPMCQRLTYLEASLIAPVHNNDHVVNKQLFESFSRLTHLGLHCGGYSCPDIPSSVSHLELRNSDFTSDSFRLPTFLQRLRLSDCQIPNSVIQASFNCSLIRQMSIVSSSLHSDNTHRRNLRRSSFICDHGFDLIDCNDCRF
ncbi:hypothetical protein GEMRC1_008586 [Eukaryota sp. GEM-RC1]